MVGIEEFRTALVVTAETCAAEVRRIGIDLPPIEVTIDLVEAGREQVRTDRRSRIDVAVSSSSQFLPPPEGANLIYGVCHEVGHLAVAAVVAPGRLPPVVWDEALAHVCAIDWFLPSVGAAHGDTLWPVPYPNMVARESAAAELDGHTGTFAYGPLLERQTAALRELIAERGVVALLAAVAGTAATAPKAEDWLWKVRGRTLR